MTFDVQAERKYTLIVHVTCPYRLLLRVGQETLSSQWTEGLVMRTSTSVTGANRIRVRNIVEDIGVEENQDLTFTQDGLEVWEF